MKVSFYGSLLKSVAYARVGQPIVVLVTDQNIIPLNVSSPEKLQKLTVEQLTAISSPSPAPEEVGVERVSPFCSLSGKFMFRPCYSTGCEHREFMCYEDAIERIANGNKIFCGVCRKDIEV